LAGVDKIIRRTRKPTTQITIHVGNSIIMSNATYAYNAAKLTVTEIMAQKMQRINKIEMKIK